jgi:DNA topoisomerase VI subunit A
MSNRQQKKHEIFVFLHDADPWGHSIYKLIDELQQIDITLHKKFAV